MPMTKAQLEKLDEICKNHALLAGSLGIGTVFIPFADMVTMGGIWASMLIKIAAACGHDIDEDYAKKFAIAVAKGSLLYMAGSRLGTWLVSLTGIGAPAAMATNAGLNYGYTLLLGNFLIQQFKNPKLDWEGLAKSAVVYLLSFGVAEVSNLQNEIHETASTLADVAGDVQTTADASDALGHATDLQSYGGDLLIDPVMAGIAKAPDNLHELMQHYGFNDSYSLISQAGSHHNLHTLTFKGLEHTEIIADSQGNNPWCGFHALGNLVQECYPGTGEWVNNHIFNLAYSHGGLVPAQSGGFTLSPAHYQPILEGAFNISCHWETFDPARAADLLNSNHGILVVGDAHDLNPNLYNKPEAWHAFNLTDVKVDDQGHEWFKGLDSNVAEKESWWPADAVQKSLAKGQAQYYNKNMLVTDTPTRWPWRNS